MTPHISAKKGEIAKTVLMPGDPLRAKFIAENFLEDYKLVNEVRGMLAYTGTYKGKDVTVMGHGMGNPSIGIYSYELYKFYDVENIIRIGSCGSYLESINVGEVIVANQATSDSTFADLINVELVNNSLSASEELLKTCVKVSEELKIKLHIGKVNSSDVFYSDENSPKSKLNDEIKKGNILAVEMEAFALYANAIKLNKNALCILTVSDSLVNHESLSSEDRRTTFKNMMILGLETALIL
jgi:purine-nucleoside phosphorylase